MTVLSSLDNLGINYLIRPMSVLGRLHLVNTFDDIGVTLVCRPLRYIHRFAAFLLDSDLYPTLSYSDLASLEADATLVSSMSSTRTSRSVGRSGTSTGRRVSERGRIRKSRDRSKGSRSKNWSKGSKSCGSGFEGSLSTRSESSVKRMEMVKFNGRR